jgi:hypothetical protein
MSLVAAAGLLFSCGTTYKSTSDNAAYNVTVPTDIISNFAVQYPDAKNIAWNSYDVNTVPIDWEMTGWTALYAQDYTVSFDMGSNKYYAWYDGNGNTLIGNAFAITDYSKLLYAINSLVQNSYKGYSIESVQRESWKSQTAYELKLVNGDSKVKLLVDSNGNILKEKK